MIPEIFIQRWQQNTKWRTSAQVEQDLVISRALTNLYNEPHIKEALVFRGGTALNKLFLKPSARYSEDIDFVQKNPDPIGQTIDNIRELLKPWLGEPKWKITECSAKLIYKYEAVNKMPAKLKIEINTVEHFQVLPLKTVPFVLESDWANGKADIITYELEELIATKLRALYQRRKGRDLFDVWYVVKQELVDLNKVFEIFSKYCAKDNINIRGEEFLKNLALKRNHPDFQSDMNALLPIKLNWNFEEAYQFIVDEIISKLP
ncbi:MAG: nucleotidyl transferase AbiEii/AbiGii toxin family protein [Holosporales bacterium]|jgi:predicted nucleotidyltransferase component of viral defense system|nr:nucleotidyl transferase AbiEii/AbiGii toxin family protein [Holosporales bacterium]